MGTLGWALGVGTLGLVLVVSLFWDHIQGVLLISQHLCSCFGVDLKIFYFPLSTTEREFWEIE